MLVGLRRGSGIRFLIIMGEFQTSLKKMENGSSSPSSFSIHDYPRISRTII